MSPKAKRSASSDKKLLDPEIRALVLGKLGFAREPQHDYAQLVALYRAWCETIPFDNAAKLIAFRTRAAGNLPGIEASQFFANFLEHGIGGTCWPSSNALYTLFSSVGFDARRLAGSMRDTGILSHGSTKVRFDGSDWLLDSSMLTMNPLPLGDELFIADDPLWSAEVEYAEGTHVIWWDTVAAPDYIPCRLLMDDATHDFYVERYEASRDRSPFNERVYVRRNTPDSILVITGNRRFLKTASGVEASVLSATQLEEQLVSEAGFSSRIVEMLRECGAIEASMLPPEGPPPPLSGPRPSRRT